MRVAVRRASVLLEVMVALAVLGFGGITVLGASRGVADAADRAIETERLIRDADRYMTAISLWPRDDLDRHLGAHRRGKWILDIARPTETLYTVRLLSEAGGEILGTTLFRGRGGTDDGR